MGLGTTNLLLGIMAAVSILEAICIVAAGIGGFVLYRRMTQLLHEVEDRQVAPALARVNGILDDVKDVTSRVTVEAERMDHAVRETVDRVDETADRVRTGVRASTRRLVALLRGVRAAIDAFLEGESGHRSAAEAASRP